MAYNFIDLAKETLMKANRPLTQIEILKEATELGLAQKINTKGKTPWQTIGARIYMDILNNPNTEFVQTSNRPAKFSLKSIPINNSNDEYINNSPNENDDNLDIFETENAGRKTFHERDLHVLLSTFVYSNQHFRCYSKTIYHENSRNRKKGYNKWLHPDMVGIYFPFNEYQSNTLKLLETLKENPYRLFSFELKIEINLNNLRQYYFQAVSNSSWSHEGYLVALSIEDDPFLYDELRRLNNAFGIGLIKLQPNNIEQSEIVFSAKNKEFLDWDTIDRLSEENIDFKNFIDNLNEDVKIGKVKSDYDERLDEKQLEEYILKMGLN